MIDPTLSGPAGRAWSCPRLAHGQQTLAETACLATWLIEQPGVHAFWTRWFVTLIHLRDIPGVQPAHMQFPTASHEVVIHALDPEHYPKHEALPGPVEQWGLMDPADLVHQFEVRSDAEAIRLVELLARAFCDGYLAADSDFRTRNADAIDQTAKHFRDGRHALA